MWVTELRQEPKPPAFLGCHQKSPAHVEWSGEEDLAEGRKDSEGQSWAGGVLGAGRVQGLKKLAKEDAWDGPDSGTQERGAAAGTDQARAG